MHDPSSPQSSSSLSRASSSKYICESKRSTIEIDPEESIESVCEEESSDWEDEEDEEMPKEEDLMPRYKKLILIKENGTKYLADLGQHSISTGLFLDQRKNRKWLWENVLQAGKATSMLNTFAHTCAWSVLAAKVKQKRQKERRKKITNNK